MIERQRSTTTEPRPVQVAPPPVLLLASEPQSAKAARLFVSDFIAHHTPDASRDHIDAVALVTCELVTNSLRYETDPDDPVRLVIDTDGSRTRVEVHDPLGRHPRLRPISVERDRGRGLLILDALCSGRWGVGNLPWGKSIWAEVSAA
ncbi:ATP-binding protein [Streptomyces sp. NPDC013157]|uniref:ATP-binding protein n=1 Tax=unclassified Streptomyces TaxID=2593676 RepID=UPI00332BA9FA